MPDLKDIWQGLLRNTVPMDQQVTKGINMIE
jgi:hypothetical protein